MSTPLEDIAGFSAEPATADEALEAIQRGQALGADFVILVREREEDGGVDEQTLMVFSPPGNPQRALFESLAERGLAARCAPKRTGGKA